MAKKAVNKIIYFDKETIRNILQERDHGEISRVTDVSSTTQSQASIAADASAKLKLEVPLVSRISFLFTGKIDASYVIKRDSTTTISSTEISEFEKLKPLLARAAKSCSGLLPISNFLILKILQPRLELLAGILRLLKAALTA